MIDLDKDLFGDHNPNSYLRQCFIHCADTRSLLALKSRLYGATLCSIESLNLTHVLVSTKERSGDRLLEIKEKVAVPVVSEDWLEKCLLDGEMVSVAPFSL